MLKGFYKEQNEGVPIPALCCFVCDEVLTSDATVFISRKVSGWSDAYAVCPAMSCRAAMQVMVDSDPNDVDTYNLAGFLSPALHNIGRTVA